MVACRHFLLRTQFIILNPSIKDMVSPLCNRLIMNTHCSYRPQITTFDQREAKEAQRIMEKVPITADNKEEQLDLFIKTRDLRREAVRDSSISDAKFLRMFPRLVDMIEAVLPFNFILRLPSTCNTLIG
jgi:hypothetical protein